jgi:hypothetical protein
MIRRKSQLELNNELVNKEMKSIFSQVSKSALAINPTTNEINNDDDSININKTSDKNNNYNNANVAINKNYLPMQTFNNESVETDSTFYNSNLVTDVYLTDDLSLLPMIDDKTLLTTIKAKFENRKYYVIKLIHITCTKKEA